MTDREPDAFKLPSGVIVFQDSAGRWCDWRLKFPLEVPPSLEGAKAMWLTEAALDATVKAAAVGWRLAHDEACDLGRICSRHQSIEAPAQRPRLIAALALADPEDQP